MGKFVDLTGTRFGRLVVTGRGVTKPRGKIYWTCLCECGRVKQIRGDHLKNGLIVSCGCFQDESRIITHTTHGYTGTSLYAVYNTMLARCENPNHSQFPVYGGRGISVCEEWKNSFDSFLEWALAAGYEEGLSIDRRDNDGNYEPSNCRWVTSKVQANNKSNNHFITYKGETHTIAEWAEITGISQYTISQRIRKLGWDEVKAITTPTHTRRK